MGKGDKRSKRGKIFKGSFGNSRPHKVKKSTTVAAPAAAPSQKKAPARKKKKEEA